MKLFIVMPFLLFLSFPGIAQPRTEITGIVVDTMLNQPLEYATITIMNKQTQKIVNGALSDGQGVFKVNKLAPGTYKVIIDFIGYQKRSIDNIEISYEKPVATLGTIPLNENKKILEEVTVTGSAPVIENKIDKIEYNAARDVTSQGGMALDVLRKVPQVTVDIDGNVELMGNTNILFLINGKPSSVFGNSVTDALSAIPANQIKTIEVITTPGAKYDAQGTGGIINIILKENKLQGVNGVVSSSAGTRLENGSVNLNIRHNQFGINAFFIGNAQLKSHTPAFQNRWGTDTSTQTTTLLTQDSHSDFLRNGYQAGLGFDWNLTVNDNISGSFSLRQFRTYTRGYSNQMQLTQKFSGDTVSQIQSLLNSDNKFRIQAVDWDFAYRKKFKRKGQELDAQYNGSYGLPNSDYSQGQTIEGQPFPYEGIKSDNPGTDLETNFSIDYTHPVTEHLILETGLKTILEDISNDANVNELNSITGNYTLDSAQSYHLGYHMTVCAGYVSSTFSVFQALDIVAGVRYEYTGSRIDFPNTTIPPYDNYVPSLIISHTSKNKKHSLKIAYSQRIERPEYRTLNPFLNLSDPYNITTGNPLLKPELGHNLELGFSNTFGNGGNIYVALYERINTQDIKTITNFYTTYKIGDSIYYNVSVTNIQNSGTEYNSGLTVSGFLPIGNLNLRTNIQVSQRYSVTDIGLGTVNMGMRYRLNLNASYQLPRNLIFELFGNYNSSMKNIQGLRPQYFTYTFALSKQFWMKKATFGFTATNPFNTYIRQKSTIVSENYNSYTIRMVPYQSFGINLSYKFGKLEVKKTKEEESFLDTPPSMDN